MGNTAKRSTPDRASTARAMHRVEIAPEYCKGCELCIACCPKHVLRMSKVLNSKGIHVAEANPDIPCIGCLQCADICPDAAIEIFRENSTP